MSVPRTRGDGPQPGAKPKKHQAVFPAHAGMDRVPIGGSATKKSVFPAHAGMDRHSELQQIPLTGVPRTRGDGPGAAQRTSVTRIVFPAHAGMDRCRLRSPMPVSGVFPAHAGMDHPRVNLAI